MRTFCFAILINLISLIFTVLCPVELGAKNLEKDLFRNALELFEKKSYLKALFKLKRLENEYAHSANYSKYLLILAAVYEKTKDYTREMQILENMLLLPIRDPHYEEALRIKIELHLKMAELDKATELGNFFLKNFPHSKQSSSIKLKLIEIYNAKNLMTESSHLLMSIDKKSLKQAQRNSYYRQAFDIFISSQNVEQTKKLLLEIRWESSIDSSIKLAAFQFLVDKSMHENDFLLLEEVKSLLSSFKDPDSVLPLNAMLSSINLFQAHSLHQTFLKSFHELLVFNESDISKLIISSVSRIKTHYLFACDQSLSSSLCKEGIENLLSLTTEISGVLQDSSHQEKPRLLSFLEENKKQLESLHHRDFNQDLFFDSTHDLSETLRFIQMPLLSKEKNKKNHKGLL